MSNIFSKSNLENLIFLAMLSFAFFVESSKQISDSFYVIAIVGALIYWKLYGVRRMTVEQRKIVRYILAFHGILFCFVFFSQDIVFSIKAYWHYLNKIFPVLIVIFFIREPRRCAAILVSALAGIIVSDIYGIYRIWEFIGTDTYIRTSGFGNTIIDMGYYVMMFSVTVLLLALKKETRLMKIVYAILFVFGIISLMLNGTRILWLYMAGAVPFILVCAMENKQRAIGVLMIMLVCLGTAFAFVPSLNNRLQSFTDTEHGSNRGHYFIMRDSVNMIQNEGMMTGVGLGRFALVFNEKYISSDTLKTDKYPPHAHNNFLTLTAENGIIVCLAFCYMMLGLLAATFRDWYQSRRIEALGIFIITLGFFMAGMTDTTFDLRQPMKMYFLLLGLYLSYRYNYQPIFKFK